MAHSKREYDRLQTKYENTYQRWRKVIGENKNILRKLGRRDDTIAELKREIKLLKVREAKSIKATSEQQAEAVNSQKKHEKIPKHSYSIIQVMLFIELFIAGAIGLRASSRAMSFSFSALNKHYSSPHWKTGSSWAMKVGYYKLHYTKIPRNKAWVWMIDYSIQLGNEKCLVILGIPRSEIPKDRALSKSDMTMLHMSIMTSSTGEAIYDILTELSKRLKVIPCQIIADEGGDLVKGIKLFCANNPKCKHTSDIKHKMAAWCKNNLGKSAQWDTFLKQVNVSRKQMQQTALTSLCAPKLRSKARYMNIGELTKWAHKVLLLIDNGCPNYDKALVDKYLGWLGDYRKDISTYMSIHELTGVIDGHIKCNGLMRQTKKLITKLLPDDNVLPSLSLKFKSDILKFITEQTQSIRSGERLVGSTEILESLFSDLKRISGQHTKSGFTRLVLALPAFIGKLDEQIVKDAMSTVRNKDIKEWAKENITRSVQSERNQMTKWLKTNYQNADKFSDQSAKAA